MSRVLKHPYVIIVCILTIATGNLAWSQVRTGHNSIKGIVTDANSGIALPSVNVFLRGTTIGTSSQLDGKFVLPDLPGGDYDLVFSLVGYEREVRHVSLADSVRLEFTIQLKPGDIRVSQVEVTGSAEEWKKLLPFFTKEFLGSTNNARDCRIINPEVISLAIGSTGDSLKAHTDRTVVLENTALGYRIYVQIDSFLLVSREPWFVMNCYPRFEEMSAQDEDQRNGWRKQRAKCYEYSFTHFLKSVIDRQIRKSDFMISVGGLRNLHRGRGDELEEQTIQITEFGRSSTLQVNFSSDCIRVDRRDQYGSWKEPIGVVNQLYEPTKNTQRDISGGQFSYALPGYKQMTRDQDSDEKTGIGSSVVVMRQRTILVDKYGNLVKPFSVSFRGFWATRRLADTLPFDYQPEKEKE